MKNSFAATIARLTLAAALATAGFATSSCQKDDPTVQDFSAADDALIAKYLTDNHITSAQKQTSGLYFLPVRTNASAPKVGAGSRVLVYYTGHLLNAAGTIFDASRPDSPLIFTLGAGRLIPGFEEGISLMHTGDKAELLIPSGLAYGAQGSGSAIPPNAVVRFEVEVIDNADFEDGLITKYLADHSITTAVKLPSGTYFLPLVTNPNGVRATPGTTASVLYTGHLLDAPGTVFDATSQNNNVPYRFILGQNKVIPGFEDAVARMHVGDRAEVIIPSKQAYGAYSPSSKIPAYSILRFELELTDVH